MTRAREGQWLRDTPATTPRKPRPKAREMSMTSRMWGMPRNRSMHQGEDRVCPPAQGGGNSAEQGDDGAHQGGEHADADRQGQSGQVRASMSRPIQSVPNRKVRLGERFMREKSVSMAPLGEQSAGQRDRQEHC